MTSSFDIFERTLDFVRRNHYVDVEDKIPLFLCSIGGHIFNALNKCSRCDFDPDSPLVDEEHDFTITNCPLRHNNMPFYTPMSRLPDTRIHLMLRGAKGSGKSVLIELFLGEGTGLLHNANQDMGIGMRTMLGPNSVTEAGMFGSVDEEGQIMGRPLAREMCGGFLGFEEFSSMSDASKKDHSMDMKNQLLTSLDNGRVNKAMRAGWVTYTTRYTVWAGTQPARFELDSGLDIMEWIDHPTVRSFESDLFRRLAIGYHMMKPDYEGGIPLIITLEDKLEELLTQSLAMRRTVMDADMELIRSTFWLQDLPKSQVIKEVSRMVTMGDYQSAKRWITENLEGQAWYSEHEPNTSRRGRKGILCRFGPDAGAAV